MSSIPDTNNRPVRRNTARKRRIRELVETRYAGTAVLLDELRWAVFDAESRDKPSANETITRSWMNSFARTIREQFPEFAIKKIPIDSWTPVGLVSRTALYRLKNIRALREFLSSAESCILCRYKTDIEAEEVRYRRRYVIPQYHAATFRFFKQRPANVTYEEIERIPGTFIPKTHKMTLIVPSGAEQDPRLLSKVPWKLFGHTDLHCWHELDPEQGLEGAC